MKTTHVRLLMLVPFVVLLSSCWMTPEDGERAVGAGFGIIGAIINGQPMTAAKHSVDLIGALFGLHLLNKGRKKAVDVVKTKVLNPSIVIPEVEKPTEPSTTQAA